LQPWGDRFLTRTISITDKPFAISSLPYANHVFRLPTRLGSQKSEHIEEILTGAFLSLLDLCISTIRHDPSYPVGLPSYNVLLTLEHIHLIPRKLENAVLEETEDKLSVNAMGFAGMLLVKSETELDAVKTQGILKILRSVGLESVHEIQVAGTSAEAEEVQSAHM
jgi:sulfate adenylyltransferase (ADP) / ATP adenylyltransferase